MSGLKSNKWWESGFQSGPSRASGLGVFLGTVDWDMKWASCPSPKPFLTVQFKHVFVSSFVVSRKTEKKKKKKKRKKKLIMSPSLFLLKIITRNYIGKKMTGDLKHNFYVSATKMWIVLTVIWIYSYKINEQIKFLGRN